MSTPETSGADAIEARLRTERKLAQQQAKTSFIDRLVRSLSGQAEENHFSMRMRDLYREGT